jgi:quercetin dioxygenase-like cupin family protein
MKTVIRVTALSLLLVPGACAPAAESDVPQGSTGAEEITRRVPQFENEHVEVWKSVIVPNQPLSMHRHDNPRAIIALQGGTLTVVSQDGASRTMTWETGRAYWLDADPPGQLHGDVNEGPEPVEVIVVQLRNVGEEGG